MGLYPDPEPVVLINHWKFMFCGALPVIVAGLVPAHISWLPFSTVALPLVNEEVIVAVLRGEVQPLDVIASTSTCM